MGLTYQATAQQYKLVIANKSECDLYIKSILCDDSAGPDFYVQPFDQVEELADEKFKKVEVFAVFPSGMVLTYVVISKSEFFPGLTCGVDGYFSFLNPNDCINEDYLSDDIYGNLEIGLWKE